MEKMGNLGFEKKYAKTRDGLVQKQHAVLIF